MRLATLCLLSVVGCSLTAFSQTAPMNVPTSPGFAPELGPPITIAHSAPVRTLPAIDPMALQHDARELLELSQALQPDIEAINRGLLPKDAIQKLKRIEKLSKQLRSQVAPLTR